ncbi:hypothetical protein E2C01_091218 [Portunus trituberculatus]|uniref:Uncharacterized protein n=1 Tax=Portunus trituberculatus TaxID=210409 RepID=A0A5B7JMZ1_PORTR|nr:hypothetical protein [Portunus trituberculatus]
MVVKESTSPEAQPRLASLPPYTHAVPGRGLLSSYVVPASPSCSDLYTASSPSSSSSSSSSRKHVQPPHLTRSLQSGHNVANKIYRGYHYLPYLLPSLPPPYTASTCIPLTSRPFYLTSLPSLLPSRISFIPPSLLSSFKLAFRFVGTVSHVI